MYTSAMRTSHAHKGYETVAAARSVDNVSRQIHHENVPKKRMGVIAPGALGAPTTTSL
jgi:hypothetical protein